MVSIVVFETQDVFAIKGEGVSNSEVSSSKICGDQLCDEPMTTEEKIRQYLAQLAKKQEDERAFGQGRFQIGGVSAQARQQTLTPEQELLVNTYVIQKWNEVAMSYLLKIKNFEENKLDELVQEAWDNYSKTRDIDNQKQAMMLQEHYIQTVSDASRAVSILKITQDNVQKAFDAAKKAGLGIIILEASTLEPTEKLEQITKINSIEKYFAAIKEAKSAEQKAIAEMRSFLFDLGKDVKHASSYPEFIKANLVQLQIELSVPGFVSEIKSIEIPFWIKNNAEWWADGKISDQDFMKGIEYLMNEGIINIDEDSQIVTLQLIHDSDTTQSAGIPEWIKNNAEWWANDQISEDEFVKVIEYLIQIGKISIDSETIIPPLPSSAIVRPNEEVTIQSEDSRITVFFPVGSVDKEVEASITWLNEEKWSDKMKETGKIGTVYNLEPSDVIFKKPVGITMYLVIDELPPIDLENGFPVPLPAIMLGDGSIEILSDSDVEINTHERVIILKGKANHFSKPFALGTTLNVKMDPPQIPEQIPVGTWFDAKVVITNNVPSYSYELESPKIIPLASRPVETYDQEIPNFNVVGGTTTKIPLEYICNWEGTGWYGAKVTVKDPFGNSYSAKAWGKVFCRDHTPGEERTVILRNKIGTSNAEIPSGGIVPQFELELKYPKEWHVGTTPFNVIIYLNDLTDTGRDYRVFTQRMIITTHIENDILTDPDPTPPPVFSTISQRANEYLNCLQKGTGEFIIDAHIPAWIVDRDGKKIRDVSDRVIKRGTVDCLKDKTQDATGLEGPKDISIEQSTPRIQINTDLDIKHPRKVKVSSTFKIKYSFTDTSIFPTEHKIKNVIQLKTAVRGAISDFVPGTPPLTGSATSQSSEEYFKCNELGTGKFWSIGDITSRISGPQLNTQEIKRFAIEYKIECVDEKKSDDKHGLLDGKKSKEMYASVIDSLEDPNDGYVLISQIDTSVFDSEEKTITSEDTDGDGIPDERDQCLTEPETYNKYQDEDGCPDTIVSTVHVADGTVDWIFEGGEEFPVFVFEILDESQKPVSGATVTVRISYSVSNETLPIQASKETDQNGFVKFRDESQCGKSAAWVTGVTGENIEFNSSLGVGSNKVENDWGFAC